MLKSSADLPSPFGNSLSAFENISLQHFPVKFGGLSEPDGWQSVLSTNSQTTTETFCPWVIVNLQTKLHGNLSSFCPGISFWCKLFDRWMKRWVRKALVHFYDPVKKERHVNLVNLFFRIINEDSFIKSLQITNHNFALKSFTSCTTDNVNVQIKTKSKRIICNFQKLYFIAKYLTYFFPNVSETLMDCTVNKLF